MSRVELCKEVLQYTIDLMSYDKRKCNMRVVVRMLEQIKGIDKDIGAECETIVKREFLIILIGALKKRLKEKNRENYLSIIATLSHLQSQLDGSNDWVLYTLIDKHYSLIAYNNKEWIKFMKNFHSRIYEIMRTREVLID